LIGRRVLHYRSRWKVRDFEWKENTFLKKKNFSLYARRKDCREPDIRDGKIIDVSSKGWDRRYFPVYLFHKDENDAPYFPGS